MINKKLRLNHFTKENVTLQIFGLNHQRLQTNLHWVMPIYVKDMSTTTNQVFYANLFYEFNHILIIKKINKK
jgi:hypothetical protein